MRKAVFAGAAYFVAVFSLGFLLGVLRVLVVAPRLGVGGAVLLELPVMLTASWMICGAVITRLGVGPLPRDRIAMSVTALVLLLIAEPVGAMILFGRTPGELIDSYRTGPALLGLASQVAFVLFPLFRRRL